MRYIKRIVIGMCIAAAAVFLITSVEKSAEQDKNSPQIKSTSDEIRVKCSASEKELLEGVTAEDKEDGNLTDKIRIGNHSRFESPGVCDLEYLVFDSGYNVGKYTRRVIYTDYRSPVLSISQPLEYQVNKRVEILDRITASDCLEGDISNRIRIVDGNVDASKEGTYMVTAEVSNSYGDVVSQNLPVYIRRGGQ